MSDLNCGACGAPATVVVEVVMRDGSVIIHHACEWHDLTVAGVKAIGSTVSPHYGDSMDDRTKQLMQAQINERRELASKLDTGGPKAKARAQALRDEADRFERKVTSDFPKNNPPSWHMRHARL